MRYEESTEEDDLQEKFLVFIDNNYMYFFIVGFVLSIFRLASLYSSILSFANTYYVLVPAVIFLSLGAFGYVRVKGFENS